MKRALFSMFIFLSGAAPGVAESASSGSGTGLIEGVCATCHAVDADPNAKSPDPKAPRFVDVAKMPSTTELSIKVFLRSSHKNMPDFILGADEIDKATAHILGLRKK
ncbi:c-type cytochrome [Methylocystis parvus]|uniref:Cytochrome c n=1 Tax=Methylocystis parvus TaxID=134 RepID=A0A6B8M875_9HYPH|nr:cytochrome c [Methylocystis parvus]QGM96940.1 cytochrome c [Methylocystis parvus]WBJ99173.1 cytochrome c [Methylocystis parvus OBBP]